MRTASPQLDSFTSESPLDRPHIARFVADSIARLAPGARVLDAGAGTAPYRVLFENVEYVTSDWAGSMHDEALDADIIAPLDALPVGDGTFDAVVCTQVLEHVPDVRAVLGELHRILVPAGRLFVTVPFVWELHEEPFDFFRFTSYGLETTLRDAGFREVAVEPYGGYFSVLGQLLRSYGSITGVDRSTGVVRRMTARTLARIGPTLRGLDRFDSRQGLPLGYAASAARG